MRRVVTILLIGIALALGGCASSPKRDVNREKAAEANANLGVRYMMKGDHERALEKLEHALTFDDDYAPAHHYLGELYRRLGRPEKAEKHFRAALRNAPDDDSALQNNFGVFLCEQGEYEEAEEQFLEVLENPVYQQRAQVYENLGLCVKRVPDIARAEKYLRQALLLEPRLPKALINMAEISYQTDKHLSARAYLQRYLEVSRHTAESLWLGIRIERILGDRDALASYELLLRNNFGNTEQARLYKESFKR